MLLPAVFFHDSVLCGIIGLMIGATAKLVDKNISVNEDICL